MFALGVIGFVLACWAPGYVVLTLRLEPRFPPFAGPFALSLMVNNLLVEALVACGFYTQEVLLPIAFLVILAGALLLLSDRRLSVDGLLAQGREWRQQILTASPQWFTERFLTFCGWLACLLLVIALVQFIRTGLGGMIIGYDPIASWNRWAIDWAQNRFPQHMWHYPQLVPVAWSIPYVTSANHEIQYFSSSIKLLFWLASFETIAFVALRRREIFIFAGIPLLYFVFSFWLGGTSAEDYADVPVAFFALLAGATVLANPVEDRRSTFAALAIASGAAMTKQVGLYMFAATPALMVVLTYQQTRSVAVATRRAISLLPPLLIAILAAAPIYVYAIMGIRNGTNDSELGTVLNGLLEPTYAGRLHHALGAVWHLNPYSLGGRLWTPTVALIAFFSLFDKTFRWLFLLIALPFTVLWTFGFSYDTRNLALAMPYWALCAAAGLGVTVRRLLLYQGQIRSSGRAVAANPLINAYGAAAGLIVFLLLWTGIKTFHMPATVLTAHQYAVEGQVLGDRPQCTAKYASILKSLSADSMTLSEWRWACMFHFNNAPDHCSRIFPDQFDFSRHNLSQYGGRDLLVILTTPSLTAGRRSQLAAAGLREAGEAQCDDDTRFFVRRAAP